MVIPDRITAIPARTTVIPYRITVNPYRLAAIRLGFVLRPRSARHHLPILSAAAPSCIILLLSTMRKEK